MPEPPPTEPAASGATPAQGAAPSASAERVLREALDDLRSEIEARRPTPVLAPRPPDWAELYDRARRWVQVLSMSERSGEVDDFGLDEASLRRARPLLDFLFERWWRVEVSGLDALEGDGPRLFVANRSGLLPWDGMMIAHTVARRSASAERPRFMVADWLVTLPFVQPTLARLGGVRACRENAQRLLRSGRSVVAFPEGAKGATKVFRERYRVQRFGRGGVIRTALEMRVPVVPVAVVGAEEVHPVLFRIEAAARAVGLPFLPVTPTFPALGPLGAVPLPSKWSIRFGEAVATAELPPRAADDDLLVWRMTEELRQRIQAMVDAGLEARASVWG